MKMATCKELKGACDAVITGSSPEEMGINSKNHVMEMVQAGDEAHKAAINEMMSLSQEEQQTWQNDFARNFDSLPEA